MHAKYFLIFRNYVLTVSSQRKHTTQSIYIFACYQPAQLLIFEAMPMQSGLESNSMVLFAAISFPDLLRMNTSSISKKLVQECNN